MLEAFASPLEKTGGILVAPDAVGGSWTSPMNEKAAIWLAKSIIETYSIDPKRILVTGFSLGGEGTYFLGSRHQNLFTDAIAVAAPVAGQTDWKIPLYIIQSRSDDVVSFSEAQKHYEAIKSAGSDVYLKSASDPTHYDVGAYTEFLYPAVGWVQERWDRSK